MRKFAIFAGLGGGFGGPSFHGVFEYKDEAEAERDAYLKAEEEYQSYEGSNGIMSWEDCYEDAVESGFIDEESMTENEIHEYVNNLYQEEIESWIEYYVIKDEGQAPEDY